MPDIVPVEVFAKKFKGGPIAGGLVEDLRTGQGWVTGKDGYARFHAASGRKLALVFHAAALPAVQTATVIVPPGGLTGHQEEITFEVPGMRLFRGLLLAFGRPKAGTRHVVTTVLAAGASLHDNFGEPGATAALVAPDGGRIENAVYLAAKDNGRGKHTTSWSSAILGKRLSQVFPALAARVGEPRTTVDGGLIFPDVPCGEYRIVAEKRLPGAEPLVFSESLVTVSPRSPLLINASPPHGPRARR